MNMTVNKSDQFILSNRLITLRKLTMKHSQEFKKLFNDPEITRHLSIPYPITIKWVREYINDSMSRFNSLEKLTWGIVKEGTGEFIGVAVLKDIDTENMIGRIGYSIGKKYWNHGYTQMAVRMILNCAFQKMNLNRIEFRIDCNDKRSIKLLEQINGKQEGTLRQAHYYNEQFIDIYLYSVLKNDYIK